MRLAGSPSITRLFFYSVTAATCILILLASAWNCIPSSQLFVPPNYGREWPVLDIGVGFDLSLYHGAVALSFANGTTRDVIRLPGNDKYVATMDYFSRRESQHFHPPYNDFDEQWGDLGRQYLRRGRKAAGLPASDHVGVLAEMVTALREKAQAVLGQPVTAATITTPHLWALYGEDVVDVFDYLHIQERPYIDTRGDERIVYHGPAVWAGHHIGLCRQYWNSTACRDELRSVPERASLAIGVEAEALILSKALMRNVHNDWEGPATIDPGAGFKHQNDPSYSDALYARLISSLRAHRHDNELERTVILSYGTYGDDDRFVRILRKALADEGYPEGQTLFTSAAAMSAARGAAELAKRGPPYLPHANETAAASRPGLRLPTDL